MYAKEESDKYYFKLNDIRLYYERFKMFREGENLLNGLSLHQWVYISIYFNGNNKNLVMFLDETSIELYNSPTGGFSKGERVAMSIGLKVASFKEIKLFPYQRKGVAKYLSHIQIDPTKEKLIFYYPLDGKDSTRFVYNAIDPRDTSKNPLINAYWINNPNNQPLCPKGYYYNRNIDTSLRAVCLKQEQLRFSCEETFDLNTKKGLSNLVGVSVWIYYDKTTTRIFSIGSTTRKALTISSTGPATATATETATAIRYRIEIQQEVSIEINYKGWIHIGYINSKLSSNYLTRVFLNCKLIQGYILDNAAPHDGTEEVKYLLKVSSKAVIRDFQLFAYDDESEFRGFEEYLHRRVYPYSGTEVIAYIPGVSLSPDNKLIVFKYEGVTEVQASVLEMPTEPGNSL